MAVAAIAFIDGMLPAIALAAIALATGALIVRVLPLPDAAVAAAARRGALAAGVAAIAWAAAIAVKPIILIDALGEQALRPFLRSEYVRIVAFQCAAALLLALGCALGARAPRRRRHWALAALAACAAIAAGALQGHAADAERLRWPLVTATALHRGAGLAWAGAVAQLAFLACSAQGRSHHWPGTLARFTPIGIGLVAVLAMTALALGTWYAGDWNALAGTAYGSMMAVKAVLFAAALGFAAWHLAGGRRARAAGGEDATLGAETALLAAALFAAANLAGLPPARDISVERASGAQLQRLLAPKLPALRGPPANAAEAVRAAAQSDREHGIAGMACVLLALPALAGRLAAGPAPITPAGRRSARRQALVFAVAGLALFTHAHDDFELRTAYLAQLAHSLIGLVAVLAAAARWLQSRAGDRAGRIAGTIADAT
ncbi:MAG: CopD family protein, partial [Gammaproteobacteria bacterium]